MKEGWKWNFTSGGREGKNQIRGTGNLGLGGHYLLHVTSSELGYAGTFCGQHGGVSRGGNRKKKWKHRKG